MDLFKNLNLEILDHCNHLNLKMIQ